MAAGSSIEHLTSTSRDLGVVEIDRRSPRKMEYSQRDKRELADLHHANVTQR